MAKKYPTVYHRIQAELQKEYDALYLEITTDWIAKWVDVIEEFRASIELWKKEKYNKELGDKVESLGKEADLYLQKSKIQSKNLVKNITSFRKIESDISRLSGYCYYNNTELPPFDYKKL